MLIACMVLVPKYSDLFNVTNYGSDSQPLEFTIDSVVASHQMLQEHLESLR